MFDIRLSQITGVETLADAPVAGDPKEDAQKKLLQSRAQSALPMGGKKPAIELAREIGQKLNLDPNMVLGSAFGEGFNLMYDKKRKGERSTAYEFNRLSGNVDQAKYPVDAFYFGGIDNFGPVAKELKKKGYLEESLDYKIMPVMNEAVEKQYLYKPKRDEKGKVMYDQDGTVVVDKYLAPKELVDRYIKADKLGDQEFVSAIQDTVSYVKSKGGVLNESVAFSSADDMLKAKAAYLRLFKDKAEDYAKRKGVKIPDSEMNYVIMSAYNGGAGAAYDLIDLMAQGKKNISQTGGSKKEVHRNLQPRMKYIQYLSELTPEQTK